MSSRAIEAMLLMASDPVSADELAVALDLPVAEVNQLLAGLADFYAETERGFELRQVAGGWRLATAPDLAPVLESWVTADQRSRLSQAALETLAVIAYLQPTTRGRIAGVRGVNVDGVVKNLLLRGLIAEAGEEPSTGATLFVTTSLFLSKLGLGELSELPDLAPLLPDAESLAAELSELAGEPNE